MSHLPPEFDALVAAQIKDICDHAAMETSEQFDSFLTGADQHFLAALNITLPAVTGA